MNYSFCRVGSVISCGLIFASACLAHEFRESEVAFSCDPAEVFGTLTQPAHPLGVDRRPAKNVCAVIIGGTLSQTRDGEMIRDGVPKREALKRLARSLAIHGYSSIRYDKVGFGKSKPKPGWNGSYSQEAEAAAAAMKFARAEIDRIEKIVVIGESAGAYLACLAAKAGTHADAYVFLGGHCASGPAIYEYNFARLVRLAENDPAWKTFAEQQLRFELALGRTFQSMFDAAAKGDASFQLVDGNFSRTIPVGRRREELDMAPNEMFRFIKAPALALSGEFDLNVPPDHAARIVSELRGAGNHDCTCIQIPQADHNFQIAPDDSESRLRERYNFESFRREYAPQLDTEIVKWLDGTFGYADSQKLPAKVESTTTAVRATERIEIETKTEHSPERVHLAPGIQLVRDITDKTQTAGVPTLEGVIGPLLLGHDCQAHFIDMPAGMYCEEHPHSSESIIYTVRGRWVLCSHGRRQVMQPGTLFHFAPNTPTGYEVPFADDAFILIFKGQRLTKDEAAFVQYLKGLAQRLEQEHRAGVPYLLKDLPADHPANVFAREVSGK